MSFEQFIEQLREMLNRLELDPESARLLLEKILKELSGSLSGRGIIGRERENIN